jgi:anti-sigma B factor antagonist
MTDELGETLEVDVAEHQGCTVLTARGTIDYWTAPPLRAAVEDAVAAPQPRVVLDLAKVAFVDSTGLSLLVAADRWTRDRGGWFRIAEPADQLRRLLSITNLDRRLAVHNSVVEAIGSGAE